MNAARDQRKADLIAASALLRPHAAAAVHDLADFGDTVAGRVGQVRAWLALPLVRRTGLVLAALAAVGRWRRRRARLAPRHPPHRVARLMTSLTLAWRLGRLVAPWLRALAPRPPMRTRPPG